MKLSMDDLGIQMMNAGHVQTVGDSHSLRSRSYMPIEPEDADYANFNFCKIRKPQVMPSLKS